MHSRILIVKNERHEGPGILGDLLEEHKIASTIVDLKAGDFFPSPREFHAMVVMGGQDSANDNTEKMMTELRRIREALDARLPYFGVCLGLQTLVKAAGGVIRKNTIREIGFRDPHGNIFTVRMTEEGEKDPLLSGLPPTIPMFHLHGETVALAPSMCLLSTGKWCENQIVRVGPAQYGIQGHLELTDAMFEDWCTKNDWLSACNRESLECDWKGQNRTMKNHARIIFGNFLRIAKLAR